MEERPCAEANVDTCTGCYGVWIEWFDGPMAKVAGSVPPPSRPPRPAILRARAELACPACTRALTVETIDEHGEVVFRCGECAGVYVPRDAIDVVARLPAGAASEPRPWIDRVIALVRMLFGR
jgi:Zn-finger nucleic acid-binding protein